MYLPGTQLKQLALVLQVTQELWHATTQLVLEPLQVAQTELSQSLQVPLFKYLPSIQEVH